MITVAATELKANFKKYANIASKGRPILVKRPQKENNLILIDENQYKQCERLLKYFARLQGYLDIASLCENEEKIIESKYSIEFMNLFGSVDETSLMRPNQGEFTDDVGREEL